MPYALDDAAVAALWRLSSEPIEHMSALYGDDSNIQRSNSITADSNRSVRGKLLVPPGTLRALVHNHPLVKPKRDLRNAWGQDEFSPDDVEQAKRLGVPSYISAGDKVFRYDPSTETTQEALGQIPIEEIRRLYLADGLKK